MKGPTAVDTGLGARVVAFAQELVRIDSTPGHEQPIVDRVVEEMRHLGYHMAEVDPAGNAVGWLGDPQTAGALVIDCHVDTVPLSNRAAWSRDPFGGELADGRLWGLGSVDMKGAVAAAVVGVGALARQALGDGRPIMVVGSIAEETMEGAALRPTLQRYPMPAAAVIAEATSLQVATAQRGRAKIRVTIQGRTSHASQPQSGINAVAYMARLITELPRVAVPPDPLLGPMDLSVIDISSEPYPSVCTTPGYCMARLDCRFLPGMTKHDLLGLLMRQTRGWPRPPQGPSVEMVYEPAEFTTFQGSTYAAEEFVAPWQTDPNSELVQLAVAAARDAGLDGRLGVYPFCTNGSLTAELGIPTIGFGPGDPATAHSADENVPIEDLARAARTYFKLAQRWAARSSQAGSNHPEIRPASGRPA